MEHRWPARIAGTAAGLANGLFGGGGGMVFLPILSRWGGLSQPINGPPCVPGNIALSICFAYCSLHMIIPPLGPRSVLCVVVVTKSANGTGLGCTPVATKPAIWAISTIK